MKKKIISAVCILLAMNLISCSWFESHPIDYNAKKKLVIKYMNEKYGKKFNISGGTINPQTWAPKDDPFSEYYCTDVSIENASEEEKYAVYHDDNETHEELWIIGDEYMMNIVEPYIKQFVEDAMKEHAPCADTYFSIWGAGSSDILEQTSEFVNNFCFSSDFPVVNSYDEFLREMKNVYLYLCIYVPESEQDIDTAVQDWQEWKEYMYSSFNEDIKLWMITVEDESFFGADDTLPNKAKDFKKTNEINLK